MTITQDIRQYIVITINYWAFTVTDGALRMLVVLYFHQLGYTPLSIALLFLFYELFGVLTNLAGAWLGARFGLNKTMHLGLSLQIIALSMLLAPTFMLTIPWVMAAQALSGIAKDLNKMSAKSAIKLLTDKDKQQQLYRWVALLTGSKNMLKGIGFFMGGVLLMSLGFFGAVATMTICLAVIGSLSLILLKKELGKMPSKPTLKQLLSKNQAINVLSAARLFLFGARDVWFVVALPVYLSTQLAWSHWQVSSFLALWVIAYGAVQTISPYLTHKRQVSDSVSTVIRATKANITWILILMLVPILISTALSSQLYSEVSIIIGLLLFGVVFAINSSLHSYLIVSFSSREGVSLDIGFYYMANAAGRLLGTLLSGWAFQLYGLEVCLLISSLLIGTGMVISLRLPSLATKQSLLSAP